jgi:hypothetical protein
MSRSTKNGCFAAGPAALLALAGVAAAQGGGMRADGVAVAGGTIAVEVGTNDDTVEVGPAGSGNRESHPVPPGRRVTVPVPPVPPGTILVVTAGRGLRRQVVFVEVIAP